jgi:hypothetical protein
VTSGSPAARAELSIKGVARRWSRARPAWRPHGTGHALAAARPLVPLVLDSLPPDPTARGWVVQRELWTETGTALFMVGPAAQPPEIVVKLSRLREALARSETTLVSRLLADPALGDWCRLLPAPVAQGHVSGRPFIVERALPGVAGTDLVSDQDRDRLLLAAADSIARLHRATTVSRTVDDVLLGRWVDNPVNVVRAMTARRPRALRYDAALDRLSVRLRAGLATREVATCVVHGDYWSGNLLATTDGSAITGIVDWDQGSSAEVPWQDILHLLLYERRVSQRQEFGDVVRAALEEPRWTPAEEAVLRTGSWATTHQVGMDTYILLCWLRHVAANIVQQLGHQEHGMIIWELRNVRNVLAVV